MAFASFSEFLQMGGHGFYVWLAYGVGLSVVFLMLLVPRLQKSRLLKQIRDDWRATASAASDSEASKPARSMRDALSGTFAESRPDPSDQGGKPT